MNFGEWKAQLIERPGLSGYQLFMYRNLTDTVEFIGRTGDVFTFKIGENYEPVPFTELTHDQLDTIAQAFASRGIKTSNDHKNAGLLEATKAHLEDMRTLVFDKRRSK